MDLFFAIPLVAMIIAATLLVALAIATAIAKRKEARMPNKNDVPLNIDKDGNVLNGSNNVEH